jgi:Fe-S cluster assembly protein SufD
VTIVDTSTSEAIDALMLPVVELDVADGARLRYVSVQDVGPAVWHVGEQASRTGRDATLRTMAVALGGDYARLRTDAMLDGKGGFNELLAVFFGEGEQMHDFRTIQEHAGPSTTSDLLFKGAVEDAATSVYSGLIRIGRDARGSRANQVNRNLILSDTASAESVPNLEILNNDVHCSHASTVGPIEDDQRYYLESRGVPPEAAERLIVLGFFGELLERIPVPALAQRLHAAVAAKLDRRTR